MSQYRAPLADMLFVATELAGLEQIAGLPGFADATPDTVAAILEEAGKFASDVLDPLNRIGDRTGATLRDDGSVSTPPGFRDAYRQFCELGWNGLAKSQDFGGQGDAAARHCRSRRDVERCEPRIRAVPDAHRRRDRGDRA